MRIRLGALVGVLLLAAGAHAEKVSSRRVVSQEPTPDMLERVLGMPLIPVREDSDLSPAPLQKGATVTVTKSLPNGDFESGPAIWTEASLNGWNLILDSISFPVPILPYEGDWGVWLGGDHDEIAYSQQEVTVPTGSPTLNYWHWIASEDDCGYDFGGVSVNSTTVVDSYDLCVATDTADWVLYTVDMAAYEGQTLTLQIRVETDDQLLSSLFVDDVYWEYEAEAFVSDGFESGDTSAWSSQSP